jgi:hypothetical protein
MHCCLLVSWSAGQLLPLLLLLLLLLSAAAAQP